MTFSPQRFYEFSLGIALFIQVLFPKLIPVGIILIALSVIALGVKRELKLCATEVHLFFILFYFAYVIGVFFTEVPKEAAHVLESKMSFVIFPLLFLFIPKRKVDFTPSIWLFSGALVTLFIWGIVSSIQCFRTSGSSSCFVSTPFSPIHHPTYTAIYYLTGFFMILKARKTRLKGFKRRIVLFLSIIFVTGYLLCMSLSALLFLFGLIVIVGFIWFRRRFGIWKSIGIVVVMLIGLIVTVEQSKDTISDVEYTYNSVKEYLKSPTDFVKKADRYLVGNEERLVLWTISAEAIAAHPFGYGTGNIDVVIGNKLRSYGLNSMAEKNFNPHNQYLQTCIELGILGVAVLIGLFIVILRFAVKHRNITLLILTASFIFNALFESMFQRQSGIVFFTLMVFFMILESLNQNQSGEKLTLHQEN